MECLLPELLPNILVPSASGHTACALHGPPEQTPGPTAWVPLNPGLVLEWTGGFSHLGLTMSDWAPCFHQLWLGPPQAGPGHVCRAAAFGHKGLELGSAAGNGGKWMDMRKQTEGRTWEHGGAGNTGGDVMGHVRKRGHSKGVVG